MGLGVTFRLLALELLALLVLGTLQVDAQGSWEVVVANAGISSMHTAVTHYDTVVLLDRTNIGPSQLPLNNGVCRDNPADRASTHDCTAHSAIYTPGSNNIRPLFIFTDTWCSSGQFANDGTLVQTGGDADGNAKIRTFEPCASDGNCDWVETGTPLQAGRWYASNQQLPNGQQIVVGGRGVFTVEYVPANGGGQTTLPLLSATNDAQNDNYYPYVHLLPNNQLFIFANQDSVLFDWTSNTVVANLPTLQGGPRNYPSAGSSVMLPLTAADGFSSAEVVVCGGAQAGVFAAFATTTTALQSCGRISPLAANPGWAMEDMPMPRTMGDMVLLPTRDVLIINGAAAGSQGWGQASNPVLTPVLYHPDNAAGSRFETLAGTNIPRVYHSTANLLADARILVAGSNTHQFYTFTGDLPTELRIEAFSPPYLSQAGPSFTGDAPNTLGYGAAFTLTVSLPEVPAGNIELNLISAPYTTHSYAQGQRLLNLAVSAPTAAATAGQYSISATSPPSNVIAPPGYYMLFANYNGVPSYATWVLVG